TADGPRQLPLAFGPVPRAVTVAPLAPYAPAVAGTSAPGASDAFLGLPAGASSTRHDGELPFPLRVFDARDEADPDAAARAWMRADLDVPFDLAAGPLFAHALFRVADDRWLWYQRVHHAVMDGYG
ncbi:hypothetical protein ADK38_25905, partial [Streptomyces varsoviensis]